jgi:ribonuclease P protein component
VKRKYRLRRSIDFQRVREEGKSYTHRLLVLIVNPNPEGELRIGISAGKSIGKAVTRNKTKRRIRASMNEFIKNLQTGWDLVFLARKPIITAEYKKIMEAVHDLLEQAGIIEN